MAPKGYRPPQGLEIEKERIIKNKRGGIYALSAQQGIAPKSLDIILTILLQKIQRPCFNYAFSDYFFQSFQNVDCIFIIYA